MNEVNFFKDEPKKENIKESAAPYIERENEINFFKQPVEKKEVKEEKVVENKKEEPKEIKEEVKQPTKKELKKLMAKYEDKDYELPLDAKIRHKVDNEELELSVQEILNNYSGKVAWDKKFSELGNEKKKYQEELETVNRYVNEFAEISKQDKIAGLVKLAEFVGIDPMQYKKQLRSDLLNAYSDYLKMDEPQRAYYDQLEELNYLKSLRESELKKQQEAQAAQARQMQFKKLQETHGIDDKRLSYLSSELQEHFGLDVTPDNIVELHGAMTRLDRVDSALEKINPAFMDDLEKITELEGLLKGNPKLTDDQLLKYATKLYGNDVEKAIANLNQKSPAVDEKKKKQKESNPFKAKVTGNQANFF